MKFDTGDIEAMRFNTAIVRLMKLSNAMVATVLPRDDVETLVLLLSPSLLLSQRSCGASLVIRGRWRSFHAKFRCRLGTGGDVRVRRSELTASFGGITAAADLGEGLLGAARSEPEVATLLAGRTVVKKIVVPGRLVNLVAN
ncbi:hypothetical protein [Rhizobium sp. NXC14]|uniref:hypothetical protein n=1 Tax=Rhizobium sp. NXC14 TaxID=1981173 RepID=UPI0012F4B063|nr:hypothetical protein [Rhizobium sp. NXC14]